MIHITRDTEEISQISQRSYTFLILQMLLKKLLRNTTFSWSRERRNRADNQVAFVYVRIREWVKLVVRSKRLSFFIPCSLAKCKCLCKNYGKKDLCQWKSHSLVVTGTGFFSLQKKLINIQLIEFSDHVTKS